MLMMGPLLGTLNESVNQNYSKLSFPVLLHERGPSDLIHMHGRRQEGKRGPDRALTLAAKLHFEHNDYSFLSIVEFE